MPKPFPRFVDLDLECTSSRIFCTFLCWGYSTLRHRNSLSCSARDSPSHQLKKRKLSFFWQGRSFPCINRGIISADISGLPWKVATFLIRFWRSFLPFLRHHHEFRRPQLMSRDENDTSFFSWGPLCPLWSHDTIETPNCIHSRWTMAKITSLSRIAHKSRSRSQCDSLSLRFNVQHEHPQTRRFSDAYRRRYAEFNLGN